MFYWKRGIKMTDEIRKKILKDIEDNQLKKIIQFLVADSSKYKTEYHLLYSDAPEVMKMILDSFKSYFSIEYQKMVEEVETEAVSDLLTDILDEIAYETQKEKNSLN